MVTETTAHSDQAASSDAAASEPAKSFDQLPLSEPVREALRDMGYSEPTDVQLAVWEPAVAHRDVVVQARTGTGKTAAFGLPIVDRLIDPSQSAVQVLILCPTRELALQVSRELDQIGTHKAIRTVAVYGGASMPRQVDALSRGVPIVAGTPGRVLDHLKRGTLDASHIKTLVLDESDEMLSMGFEKELTAIMERLPDERQTMLFSATLPPNIERMVRSRLDEPAFVLLSGDHIGALEVSHYVYMVTQDKLGSLVHILEVEDPESAVIFCNTREQTETVALALQRHGFNADWLNGDLPQSEREKVMGATREGKLRFMVATDVAARGIDISHLSHVINYDFPQDAEGYVHRTGRTGRAGRMGMALSLITAQDIGAFYLLRLTYGIRPVERSLPTPREQRTRLELDVVQSLVSTFAPRGHGAEQRGLARRLLTHPDAEAVIAGMLAEYLSAHPGAPQAATTRRRDWTPPPKPARERGGRRARGPRQAEPAP
ncbi:MAG: DEAD/DEAH box helicase, partial [Deltaproteobacteria bacterium]|nr:DEAD/DEAH box helicase [Deltaproteobacteria bacterium]MBW2532194.1 DEAD/DEAH box helicase [Deltaproteobacteria bacterium]